MKRVTFLLTLLIFIGMQMATAQKKVITGKVTSAKDGSALPGVTVVVKGTTVGTSTDINGEYQITVPENYNTLVFSFVGMKTQEVNIGNNFTINVALEEDVLNLDEVVVTAIGVKRETKALGYAVQKVAAEQIEKAPNVNLINSLNARVAGVKVNNSSGVAGASTFIEIRGSASLTGNNQPLFVVDGVPIISGGGAYSVDGVATSDRGIDINPDDIAEISVLKSGAATALYGLRAANGAIVITTKRGAAAKGKAIHVNFSTSYAIDKMSQVPALQMEFAQGSKEASKYYFGSDSFALQWPDGYWYKQVSWGPRISELVYDDTDKDYMEKWDPNGRPVYKWQYPEGKPVHAYDPYEFFQLGKRWENSLSFSGGTDISTYYFSLSTLQSEGIVPNNTFNRYTFRLTGETKLSEKFKSSASVYYANSDGNRIQQGSNTSGVMLGLTRTPPTFDNSFGLEDPVNDPRSYQFPDGSQRNYRGGTGYDNPYWIVNNISYHDYTNRFTGWTQLDYLANDWLSVTYRLGTDWYNRRYKDRFQIGSNTRRAGYVGVYQYFGQDINSDLYLTIDKKLNDDIRLTARLGNNMFQSFGTNVFGEANSIEIPGWYNLANSSDVVPSEGTSKYRTAAFYADLGFDYKSMWFVDLTGREEWSTTLPADGNKFFYPSVSTSFIFTELDPLSDLSFLPFGKIRASYAVTARAPGAYNLVTPYFVPAPGDGWTTGLSFPLMGYTGFTYGDVQGSSDLRPEKLTSMEFGADLRFFENRLGLDIAYYINKSSDLLMSVPVAPSTGFDNIYTNAASMETKGFEIYLRATPVKTSDFRWDLNLNFDNGVTMVTGLAEGIDNVFLGGFVDPQVRAMVGERYRSIWGTRWLRDDQGNLIINDDPGYPPTIGYPLQDAESGILGVVPPDWVAGIENVLSWKGFRLSFLLDIKKGGQMWNGTKGALYYFGKHADQNDRETATIVFDGVYGYQASDGTIHYTDGQGNEVSTPVKNTTEIKLDENWYFWEGPGSGFTGPSEPFVENTDWVRLREITLSYTFDSKLLDKIFIDKLDIYFTGKNLWLSTPYTGVDPETSLLGASNAQGFDYFNMPGTKTYLFGLRAAF